MNRQKAFNILFTAARGAIGDGQMHDSISAAGEFLRTDLQSTDLLEKEVKILHEQIEGNKTIIESANARIKELEAK